MTCASIPAASRAPGARGGPRCLDSPGSAGYGRRMPVTARIDVLLSTLNATDVGTLDSIQAKLEQVRAELLEMDQPELAARADGSRWPPSPAATSRSSSGGERSCSPRSGTCARVATGPRHGHLRAAICLLSQGGTCEHPGRARRDHPLKPSSRRAAATRAASLCGRLSSVLAAAAYCTVPLNGWVTRTGAGRRVVVEHAPALGRAQEEVRGLGDGHAHVAVAGGGDVLRAPHHADVARAPGRRRWSG